MIGLRKKITKKAIYMYAPFLEINPFNSLQKTIPAVDNEYHQCSCKRPRIMTLLLHNDPLLVND